MTGLEEPQEFECPYCMVPNSLMLDRTGGKRQSFVTDCETCCQPITIEIVIEADGYVELSATPENE